MENSVATLKIYFFVFVQNITASILTICSAIIVLFYGYSLYSLISNMTIALCILLSLCDWQMSNLSESNCRTGVDHKRKKKKTVTVDSQLDCLPKKTTTTNDWDCNVKFQKRETQQLTNYFMKSTATLSCYTLISFNIRSIHLFSTYSQNIVLFFWMQSQWDIKLIA